MSTFSTALKNDIAQLKRENRRDTDSQVAILAPSVPSDLDDITDLGKNIARYLYALNHSEEKKKSQSAWDTKAFNSYRKDYLTPLRAAMNVIEALIKSEK